MYDILDACGAISHTGSSYAQWKAVLDTTVEGATSAAEAQRRVDAIASLVATLGKYKLAAKSSTQIAIIDADHLASSEAPMDASEA